MTKNNFAPVMKIGFLYAASIAGAGFASGKEIHMFFTKFGDLSILGIVVAAFFFAVSGIIIMKTVNSRNVETSEELFKIFFGKYSKILEYIVASFVFIVFSAMLAGSGEILNSLFWSRITPSIYSMLVLFVCFIIFNKGIEFLQKFSITIMGILFSGIIFFSFYIIFFKQQINLVEVWKGLDNNIVEDRLGIGYMVVMTFWQAILYCGYNGMLSVNTLIVIARGTKNAKQLFYGGVSGGIIFLIAAVLINFSMLQFDFPLEKFDFPFIAIIKSVENHMGDIYSFFVLMAMFLSIIINGFFLFLKSTAIPLCAFLMVFSGFSGIISFFYPIFGFLGLIFLLILIIRYFMIK